MIITVQRCLSLFALMLVLVACSKPPYTDTRGDAVSLSSDKGQWLALNFWAEWCDPCRHEIPELNALAVDGAVRVVGVDFDGSQGQELNEKVAMLNIRFPVIEQSPLQSLGAKEPQVLPATLILNPQGQVVETLYGPQTKLTLENRIRKLQERN
ncbi:hypothetical protein ACH42_16350 [Endozoicomonas sp. (ex Bugula neritina AB1)]|nr:hypothetical protein ACH42_16350 [Endozoicomonas sp. (ex Bugula neritina AB1)]